MLIKSAGTGVSVFAFSLDSARNYTAQCFLDGIEIRATTQFGNNEPICAGFGLPANTMHTISVSVLVPPQEEIDPQFTGFCFDYLLVEPSPSMSLDGYDLFLPTTGGSGTGWSGLTSIPFLIPDVDSVSLTGSTGWIYDQKSGYRTSKFGAQLNVTFTGNYFPAIVWQLFTTKH